MPTKHSAPPPHESAQLSLFDAMFDALDDAPVELTPAEPEVVHAMLAPTTVSATPSDPLSPSGFVPAQTQHLPQPSPHRKLNPNA